VKLSYDSEKRDWTLEHRGLDFENAAIVFAGVSITAEDDRKDYGEQRLQTYGFLNERLVTIIWTKRGDARHIISMRKCNGRERRRYERELAGS